MRDISDPRFDRALREREPEGVGHSGRDCLNSNTIEKPVLHEDLPQVVTSSSASRGAYLSETIALNLIVARAQHHRR